MYWQKKGDFLAVKVERYTKSKKVFGIFDSNEFTHVFLFSSVCLSALPSVTDRCNHSYFTNCKLFLLFKAVFSTLELFRTRMKDIPVDTLELKGTFIICHFDHDFFIEVSVI